MIYDKFCKIKIARFMNPDKHAYIRVLPVIVLIFCLIIIVFPVSTCKDSNEIIIDYGNSSNWIALPLDSDKSVDVFYVYPTVSGDSSGNMNILDSYQRELANGIFKSQSGVFEDYANVYAPYYRQMTTSVDAGMEPATETKEFKVGAVDVISAFDYYISNYNKGHPFILAGHSQGTMALIELIKKRFGNDKSLRKHLVAAYLIGYTVTDSDLVASGLKAAKRADDTGVVISYNTQSRTSSGGPMLLQGAICINPLSWKTDTVMVDASENIGAVFSDDETGKFIIQIKEYCSAEICNVKNARALVADIPENDSLDIGPYTEGVYHRYDYAFWYRNLRENVRVRINAYFSKINTIK